jgi:hypothetical protein
MANPGQPTISLGTTGDDPQIIDFAHLSPPTPGALDK